MKYFFNTTWIDYPDNVSYALSIFFLGCEHNCVECHSPHLKNSHIIDLKEENYKTFLLKTKSELVDNYTNKIVLCGGDPLFKDNLEFAKGLLNDLGSKVDICVYTGYDIEYVIEKGVKGFKFIKCGRFEFDKKQISEKTDSYIQFASTNQKLYDGEYNLLSNDGKYFFI